MNTRSDVLTGFELLLKEQSETYWMKYRQLVDHLRSQLPNQQDFLHEHTEHHIRKVLRNADLLVPDELKKKWSAVEIFLFLCSVWLHDIGMMKGLDSTESYKQIRARHAQLSYLSVIHFNKILGWDEQELIIIAYIVKGHALPDLDELPEKKGLGICEAISVRPLAALLRLADVLDINLQRVPDLVKEFSGSLSKSEWSAHKSIDNFEINNSLWDLVVYSTPKSFEALDIMKHSLSLANETLDAIRSELHKLRLLYRQIDLVVDDTYLLELEKEAQTEKNRQCAEETTKDKAGTAIKLCPFTGTICNIIHNEDETMVFIGMPFAEDFVDVYRFAIQPAVESKGYTSWRADEVPSSGPIFCKVCAAIHKCCFAVIDISSSNPNVMFELGMAAAFGKRVVLIKNHKHSVPTDLAGFEYISYRNAYELKDTLARAIPKGKDGRANKSLNSPQK